MVWAEDAAEVLRGGVSVAVAGGAARAGDGRKGGGRGRGGRGRRGCSGGCRSGTEGWGALTLSRRIIERDHVRESSEVRGREGGGDCRSSRWKGVQSQKSGMKRRGDGGRPGVWVDAV